MKTPACLFMLFFVFFSIAYSQGDWKPLLNGKDLTGWEVLNGQARFFVQNGAIVGQTVVKSPNSFLCTKERFANFILELEVLDDPELNSGVQIRSQSLPGFKNGRVHGYQVEIDPSERSWTGGIYDEARRGWLYPLDDNPSARKAFKSDQWNKFRIEAVGNSIRTWVNGIACASLLDDLTKEGFIGLQVHGIGEDRTKEGLKVMFRNIRIMTNNMQKHRMQFDETVPEINKIPNTLTEREKKENWKLLWDGRTTEGWRGAKLDRFPTGGWQIKDGILSVLASGGAESRNGGDIVTTSTYENFELTLEFKISEGANSGIKYFVDTDLNKGEGSAIGCEYQILDDAKHADAKLGVDGNRTLAGLYDLIAPTSKRFNSVGEWNQARIVVRGNHVEHWLNGFKVVQYERANQMWRALVSHSKYRVWPNFGEQKRGHILLQDHGDEVSFRSIKLRVLE